MSAVSDRSTQHVCFETGDDVAPQGDMPLVVGNLTFNKRQSVFQQVGIQAGSTNMRPASCLACWLADSVTFHPSHGAAAQQRARFAHAFRSISAAASALAPCTHARAAICAQL